MITTNEPRAMDNFFDVFFGDFQQACPIAIAELDIHGMVLHSNPPLRKLTRQPNDKESGWSLMDIMKEECRQELQKHLSDAFAGLFQAKPCSLELQSQNSVNETSALEPHRTTVSAYFAYMDGQEGNQASRKVMVYFIDTTEQKNLEMRFAHSQKMQAVGQLAGGVAHDFNNLLTAMIGFCDLLLMRHPAGDPSFADIMQVKQNANRAANLVRQLLAFSRRQTLQPKVLNITDVLAELSHLIRRLIGENIELNMVHGRDIGKIKVDQGQLEQVIINLAVNARDAMNNGGMLSIRTQNVKVTLSNRPDRFMYSPSVEDSILNGEYVLVEVTDTGCGISAELIQQIFEPFFSTKEVGSGTGLGLSTVYGIVKQTGGYIYVSSVQEEGTTFHIYFPSFEHEAGAAKLDNNDKNVNSDLTGSGTILLVEDETPVRTFAARALGNKGYKILEADSAETAMEIMSQHGHEIQVIVSDVIMPGMTGPDMVVEILKTYPDMKVIFISGYAEDAFMDSYGADREFNFLPKPFTLKQLASKVKEVMEA